MAKSINQSEMDSLLSELEIGLTPMLKAAKDAAIAKLSKSGDPAEGSASPGGESGGPPASATGDSASASAGAPSAPSAPSPDAGSAPPAADPAGSPDGGAPAGPADPAELEAAYAQLPPDQLKAHYIAAKSALFQKMGAGGGAPAGPGGSPSAPPPAMGPGGPSAPPPGMDAGASAPPPPPPGASPDPTMKAEIEALKGKLAKSESAVKEQDEVVGKLAKTLGMLLKPERKAVTGVSFIAKSESDKPGDKKDIDVANLTKNDVSRLLKPKMDDILKKGVKADLEAIKSFFNGDVDANAIKHLLG